jgi:formate-dependent nitrite reductase membrane component NrfD
MFELTTTRHNPMVDPAMHVWGWEIPVYLFLGGLVAGILVICAWLLVTGRFRTRDSIYPALPVSALVLLSAGMGALFLDLEHKLYVWRLYTTFEPSSPMSWGAWILVLVYPLLFLGVALRPPVWLARRWPALESWGAAVTERPKLLRAVGWTNMFLGALLGVYTGVLLSALGARPLWNSALLGPLFLLSGLSSAAALIHVATRNAEERVLLARADNAFLSGELAVILLFVVGLASAAEAHLGAAGLLLGGPYTAVFWVLVVGAGIAIPLVIQILAVSHRIPHTPVAPLLVLAGGLLLRFVFVHAGQVSHWPFV